ncbi:DUF4012 domain-containing protein [Methanobacterium alkalithermotolerans]|uniref:DUF4012 domain-containing protein n=1 Tax=Methanobacterium alkalithermotolerans TaxID=2731220 RepID=A0A8T8KAC6_9EURY|nr:DUF4012 domain-containing protein [Methanobacterium alkalithermotolerans]QUH23770.1 DUF4012 domain-containing protein [Methanobacterium alkalithermotolerans]
MLKKLLLVIVLLIVAGSLFFAFQFMNSGSDSGLENQTVLLLAVDPGEQRPGMGGVDMAFALEVEGRNIKKITPIYPGGLYHPTQEAPPEIKAQGLNQLVMHDSLWDADPEVGAKLAQEIVEYHTGIKTDTVIIVNPTAVDALIQAVGPVNVPGRGMVSGNSIEFLRYEQTEGMSRGNAVESLMRPIFEKAQDEQNFMALSRVAIEQYLQGNIAVVPQDQVLKFALANGLGYFFNK